jgi:CysZ protein
MDLFTGLRCFADGFRLVTSRGMRKYVLAPASLSLVLIVSGLAWTFGYVDDFGVYLNGFLPEWLSFLAWIITPLLYLFALLLGAWTFSLTATIIASPFLGELSKQVELSTSRTANEFIDTPWWRQILPALKREMRKLGYHLPRLALLLVLSIVPGINVVAPFAWLGFGAWMMAAQFCDYANENHGKPFTETLSQLRRYRMPALGFGGCTTLAMAIPLLSFLVVPIAVAGGTLLWQEIHDSEHNPSKTNNRTSKLLRG